MTTIRIFNGLAAAGLICANLGGCPADCSSNSILAALPAVQKITNCRLGTLTTCEVKIVANVVKELNPDVQITLSDADAQAVIDFIAANDLNCIEDVQALIMRAEDNPGSIVIPPSVIELLINHAGDVSSIQGLGGTP